MKEKSKQNNFFNLQENNIPLIISDFNIINLDFNSNQSISYNLHDFYSSYPYSNQLQFYYSNNNQSLRKINNIYSLNNFDTVYMIFNNNLLCNPSTRNIIEPPVFNANKLTINSSRYKFMFENSYRTVEPPKYLLVI